MVEVKATKSYDEYIAEHPDLYEGVDGYTWSEDDQKWINTGVAETTKTLIADWFGLRTVCSDDNFARFFRRKMNSCALRYANLSRIELTAFDPLVANYIERETIENNNKTANSVRKQETAKSENGTRDSSSSHTDNNESTRTPDIKRTDESNDTQANTESATDKVTKSGTDNSTDNVTHTGSAQGDHKEMDKIAPQSISYEGAVAGNIPNLDWRYATSQKQAQENKTDNSTDNTEHTGSTSGEDNTEHTGNNTGNTNHTGESHESGNEKTVGSVTGSQTGHEESNSSGTGSIDESGNSSESEDSRRRERESGRGGLTPQEALRTAVSYLETSSAWEWLRRELETCFLCIYDI